MLSATALSHKKTFNGNSLPPNLWKSWSRIFHPTRNGRQLAGLSSDPEASPMYHPQLQTKSRYRLGSLTVALESDLLLLVHHSSPTWCPQTSYHSIQRDGAPFDPSERHFVGLQALPVQGAQSSQCVCVPNKKRKQSWRKYRNQVPESSNPIEHQQEPAISGSTTQKDSVGETTAWPQGGVRGEVQSFFHWDSFQI